VSYTLNSVPGPNLALDAKAAFTVDLVTEPGNVIVLDAQAVGPPGPKGDTGAPGTPGGAVGAAGGVLAGTYPDPGFAQDMATQAELNGVNAAAVHLTGAETVAGVKTFSAPVVVTGASVSVGSLPAQSGTVRLPNGTSISARNAANSADLVLLDTDPSDNTNVRGSTNLYLQVGVGFKLALHATYGELADGYPLAFGTTSGSNIGTGPLQKMGFYGAVPIVRPTATPVAAVDPATTMALVNDVRAKLIALGLIS